MSQTKKLSLHQSKRPPANYNLNKNYKNKILPKYPGTIYDGAIPMTSTGLRPENLNYKKKIYLFSGAVILFIPRLMVT